MTVQGVMTIPVLINKGVICNLHYESLKKDFFFRFSLRRRLNPGTGRIARIKIHVLSQCNITSRESKIVTYRTQEAERVTAFIIISSSSHPTSVAQAKPLSSLSSSPSTVSFFYYTSFKTHK